LTRGLDRAGAGGPLFPGALVPKDLKPYVVRVYYDAT
jgi:hypothetical protein